MQRRGNKIHLDKLEQKIDEAFTLFELSQDQKNQIKFHLRVREIYTLMNTIKPKTLEEGKRMVEIFRKFEQRLATVNGGKNEARS